MSKTKIVGGLNLLASEGKSTPETILRVVGGPAAGREIPIRGTKVTVGRAITADISIPDTVISRTHVVISLEGKTWKIKDLGSTNGTWVRGEKISGEVELPLKAPVRIGNTLFELYVPTVVEHETSLDESLISYRVSPLTVDSLTVQDDAEALQFRQERQRLAAIYQVQSLLTSVSEDNELYHKILDVISDVIPSDSSYLLLYQEKEDAIVPVAGRNRKGRIDIITDNVISRSIVHFVKQQNQGILSVDAANDERFQSMSLCGFNVHSVMCAPMMGRKQLRGLIYLSSMKSTKDYGEEDLKLLTIIAHSAGMAIENNRLVDDNIRAARMAAIGLTAAGLSHHVKNVLNGLEGSVSLLRLGIDTSDTNLMNEAWEILAKNHKQLSTLVLDLLHLSKDDATQFTRYNTANIVAEVVELVHPQAMADNISMELAPHVREAEFVADIDCKGLHRVLLNLLNNAVYAVKERHGNSGEGKIKVDLRFIDNDQSIAIEVRDNGTGIPADRHESIFEMFHTSKGDHGTGLGLAVSKRIIDNHNGKILVDSLVNEYTTFTVITPVRQERQTTDIPSSVN